VHERGQVVLAAEERRGRGRAAVRVAHDARRGDRLGLASQDEGLDRLEGEDVAHQSLRLRPDEHAAEWSG
jgi:hypothetical protein